MLADCLHDLAALGPAGLPALVGSLFLAGLAGGLTHCAGMCGPFVLAQAGARADSALSGGSLRRLAGAALLPYHLGRATGYAALGAAAGGFGALLAGLTGMRFVAALLLALAALAMLAQGSARLAALLPRLPKSLLPDFLSRRLGPLLAAPGPWAGFRLGFLLSALPCGLLWAALAGAAASGSALAGALAMAGFATGTVPALLGVALLGQFFRRVAGGRAQALAGRLFMFNGVVLLALALRLAG
ncbi:sulfite exporter TauE/SafE family protein [Sabulicella rubraurantiaca]|uniref:sulfite exporter TauE/SafE family protein n=1 Tax=Sabulicella rubraurantiaca TaxID=2811429 RepID=UPI001A97B899|nr:sulfite exporter TauE/SafE family protein [Sabulicella rubraurantiaca]